MSCTIKQISKSDRPRERLITKGAESLSDAELLAVILRTGVRGENALLLSQNILSKYGFQELAEMSTAQLQQIKGIGEAKACSLRACFEINKRMIEKRAEKKTIEGPEDVAGFTAARMRDSKREIMKAVFLNARKQIIAIETISIGTRDSCLVSARDVVRKALEHNAAAVILVHNHPGSNPLPSKQDKRVTEELKRACSFFSIKLLDHLIVSEDYYYSFRERGILKD